MTAPGITERLAQLRASASRERLSRFGPQSLLWLAAMPEWPLPLASACGFPTGPAATLPDLVGELAAAGLVERRDVLDDDGDLVPVFWLPPSGRPDVGGHLQETLGREVLDAVWAVWRAVTAAAGNPPSRQLVHWLRGVEAILRDPSGTRLNTLLDGALGAGQVQAAVEALAAAQAVGDVVGEPMTSAARRGRWRLDRAYRQAHDERALRDYLPRPELEGVLADLVQGRVGAVHLLGHGGVGKTMVIRQLASGSFARAHGLEPFPVARVDFDHLDPRYPQTRPAELLLALAAELTGYTSTRGSFQSWRRFDDAAAALHETLAGSGEAAAVTDGQLDAAVDAFAAYLDGLGGPVVLVLDTCEELAKLHAPGAPSPALDRTFDVVERVRARTGAARFLLAGRRWLVPRPGEPAGGGDILLRPREYLKVVPVRGFTGPEADAYIDHRDPGRRIGTDLRRAITERCVTGGDVNPFDLACYVDWAAAEPGLDPATLRRSPGDPYVEQRILGRLTDADVREAVPVAVLLGRFDRDMIAPTLARRGIDPGVAFSGLAGQEWVSSASFHADGRPRVIEVDEHLRSRLLTALRSWRDVGAHDVAADLRRMVSERPVEDLPVEAVEAALRLLPPRAAGELWVEFELKIARAGAWGWAAQVLPRIAAVEAELAERRAETVLGGILATQAAATLRQPGRPGLAELWSQVEALAPRHPDAQQVERLAYRSGCGLTSLGSLPRPVVTGPGPGVDLWSYVSAVDASPRWAEPDVLTRSVDPRASATSLLARAALTGSVADVDAALARLDAADPGEFVEPIIDWVLPPRLRDRARLARTVLALSGGERPEDLPLTEWRAEALDHLDDVDSNRLAAATLALESAWRLPDPTFVAAADERESYAPRHGSTFWHTRIENLRVWVARSVAAFGDPARAARMLRRRQDEAISHGEDPDTITVADKALAELCRTFRTDEYTGSLHRLAREGSPDVAPEARAALALLDGDVSPIDPAPPATLPRQPRLAAQQAMRSGELRALTRPRDACPLLHDAVHGFHAVEDFRSAYRARVLLVLTAARAGLLDEIRELLGDPPLPWRQGKPERLGGGWPDRERLARAVLDGDPGRVRVTSRSPELAFVDQVTTPPRRPGVSGSPAPTAPPAMRQPPAIQQPSTAPPPPPDPSAQPRPQPVPYPAQAPPGRQPSPGPPARARWGWRVPLAILALLPVVLAAITAVVVVLPTSGDANPGNNDPGRSTPSPGSSLGWGPAALVVGLLVVLAAGWLGRRRLGRTIGRWHNRPIRRYTQRTLAVVKSAEPVWVGIRASATRRRLAIRAESGPGGARPSTPEGIAHLARRKLSSRRPYLLIPVLEGEPDDAPWDHGVVLPAPPPDAEPLFVRVRSWSREGGIVTASWSPAPLDRPRGAGPHFRGPYHLAPDRSENQPAGAPAGVLHLVGEPVPTAAGWRLRVQGAVSEGARFSESRGKYAGEELLDPGGVASARPTLVVLQADPCDGPPQPLDALREGMIALSRVIRSPAGRAVLVIPPVPDSLARDVIQRVAGFGRRPRKITPGTVLDLTHELRVMIGGDAGRDVLLFV